ncbi:unnamed protein product [Allacma fusca]|uniref:Uncharacterized protein n=1 Tax=Allacma fusca TaxID=39272 RepID=A0A8J2L4B7_9HEXA|nr:unnamed protein product [Allacma fusca]
MRHLLNSAVAIKLVLTPPYHICSCNILLKEKRKVEESEKKNQIRGERTLRTTYVDTPTLSRVHRYFIFYWRLPLFFL